MVERDRGADIDRDGDIDYAVANFGLNTNYHASADKPSLLFYGDYAGDGKKSLVEAKYENNVLLPVRDKLPQVRCRTWPSGSTAFTNSPAPHCRRSIPSQARTFAQTVSEHVGIGNLDQRRQGQFQFKPLPLLAQVSPGFGLCFLDANADGNIDLFMAKIFFGPQFGNRPFAGGLSVLLLGNGMGEFSPLSPDRSGIVIPGDATAATVTDFNGDGHLDLAVAQNNGPVRTFESTASGSGRSLRICLDGGIGNPSAAGARVTAHLDSGGKLIKKFTLDPATFPKPSSAQSSL